MEYVTLNNGIKMPMEQNFNVFDFILDSANMEAIRRLDEGESQFSSHCDLPLLK